MKKLLCIVLCFLMVFSVTRFAIGQSTDYKPFEYITDINQRFDKYKENSENALSLQEMLYILSQYEFMTVNALNEFVELYDYIEAELTIIDENSDGIFDYILDYLEFYFENIFFKITSRNYIDFGLISKIFDFGWALVWDGASLLVISFRLVRDLLGLSA